MKASNDSTIVSDGKYIYEGWNLIAEYNLSGSTLTRQKVHYWGPDISGSLQGAGGVGGLVATKLEVGTTGTFYTGYDPNGNVTEMFNSSGSNVAHYEYDAFGKTINSAGAQVADFKMRFSTKFWDDESSLYYYGYRYYDPNHGRWLNRDPIGERGGLNLYGFVGNDGVGKWDYLGLEKLTLKYDLAPEKVPWYKPFHKFPGKAVASFSEMSTDAKGKVGKHHPQGKDPCNCIKLIQIGGEGHEGAIETEAGEGTDESLKHDSFWFYRRKLETKSEEEARAAFPAVAAMLDIQQLMCEDGVIEFIACESCAGENGKKLMKEMKDIFGEGSFKGYETKVRWGSDGQVREVIPPPLLPQYRFNYYRYYGEEYHGE